MFGKSKWIRMPRSVVLVDKQGVEEMLGVPVYSLVQAIRVGNAD